MNNGITTSKVSATQHEFHSSKQDFTCPFVNIYTPEWEIVFEVEISVVCSKLMKTLKNFERSMTSTSLYKRLFKGLDSR